MSNCRKCVRVVKCLLAGVTLVVVCWVACVAEFHSGVHWAERRQAAARGLTTMRTIVAYSAGKRAEMERPSPVACERRPAAPAAPHQLTTRSWRARRAWQRVAGARVALYAAYYDDRATQRYVRLLATYRGRNISTQDTLYCQTRSRNTDEDSVEVVTAKPLEMWWPDWDINSSEIDTPLLLSCPLTESLYGPSIVSVVTQPCDDPTNSFYLDPSVIESKRTFTICVKDLKFDKNIATDLVEWIETNKILGVDLIDIYVDEVTKETKDILVYYRDKGYVRLFDVPIKHNPNRSLWQRRRDHIITYNDCLYRNIKESDYVVPLDIDEIILPKIANTWPELLTRLNNQGWNTSLESAVIIQNVFFFDFMQGIDQYKSSNAETVKSRVYTKRDDVRIKYSNNLDIGDVELIGDIELIGDSNNFNSEVIDFNDVDKVLNEKYRLRCGVDIPTPKLARHVVRSAVTSPVGYYSKSWMLTRRVLTAFNHYPLTSLGASGFAGWAAPFKEVQLNHYKAACNATVMGECARYARRARRDRAALRLRRALTRALAQTICPKIQTV